METNWKNWCRLCGSDDENLNNVFIKDETFCSLSEAIQKFFTISINPYDEAPTKICQKCNDFIDSLLKFSSSCIKTQEMYSELQFNYTFEMMPDIKMLRDKYGLKNKENAILLNEIDLNLEKIQKIDRRETRSSRKKNLIDSNDFKIIDPQKIIENAKNQNYDNIENNDDDDDDEDDDDDDDDDEDEEDDDDDVNDDDVNDDDDETIENIENSNLDFKIDNLFELKPLDNSIKENEDNNLNANNILINRNEQKLQCEKCPKIFTLMARYLVHLKNKHSIIREPPKKIKQEIIMHCKVCKKGFSNRGSYHLHLKLKHSIIEGPVIHKCIECNKNFKTSGALTSHKRIHQKLEERIFFPCNICNKKFSSEYTCETHIRTRHNGEKPFVCDQCGKTLTSKRSLHFHQFVHTESEPLQCELCSKMFTNQLRLSVHIRTHSQIPVNCPVCNLTLKNKTFLNHHMITHSDEKQFKCTFCGNEFKRKKNLRTHMIIHTGLKPYECTFCSQSYSNRSNCKKHEKHAHPDEFAALEATGKEHYSKNIPKLSQLQAMLDQMSANQH